MDKESVIRKLTDKNDKAAYEYAKKIIVESAESDKYLDMISDFVCMLKDKSSLIRTRFFILISCQARWANNDQIGKIFDQMEPLLNDPKPTVVRQCLNSLHEVVLFRPELSDNIKTAVSKIDLGQYEDSMSSLIMKDIDELLRVID